LFMAEPSYSAEPAYYVFEKQLLLCNKRARDLRISRRFLTLWQSLRYFCAIAIPVRSITLTRAWWARGSQSRANHGEGRADSFRWARRHRRRREKRRPKGPAARSSLESALLRRDRPADRLGRYVVLPKDADRPCRPG